MSKFNVINPSNENYAAVAAQLEQNSDARFDYSGLARAYNGLEVKAIINFEYPKAKITMLAKQLEKRGLIRDIDFGLSGAKTESGTELAFVTRFNDKASTPLAPATRAPRKPKPAADAGAAAAAEGKGKGKGK